MDMTIQVQIQNKAVCVLLWANALGESLLWVNRKADRALSPWYGNSQGEWKLWIQNHVQRNESKNIAVKQKDFMFVFNH